uniref:Uncharacterized protein n=1 Tax=Strongyloides venezuelensis TaxID=75913 RepID=A0A0K0FR56_STRVS
MSLFQNSGKNNKSCKESLNSYTTSCEPSKDTESLENFITNKRRSVTFSSGQERIPNQSSNNSYSDSQIGNTLKQPENYIPRPNQPPKTGKNTFYKTFNPFYKASNNKNLFNNDDERLPLKATEVINQPSVIDRHQETLPTNNNNNISDRNNRILSNQETGNSKLSKFFLNRRHSPLRPLKKPIDTIEKLGPQQPSNTALLPKIFGIRHSLTGGKIYVSFYTLEK